MILYTIVDLQEVFAQPREDLQTEFQPIGHGYLETVREENGHRITRIISTDPADYLNPGYAPGQLWS